MRGLGEARSLLGSSAGGITERTMVRAVERSPMEARVMATRRPPRTRMGNSMCRPWRDSGCSVRLSRHCRAGLQIVASFGLRASASHPSPTTGSGWGTRRSRDGLKIVSSFGLGPSTLKPNAALEWAPESLPSIGKAGSFGFTQDRPFDFARRGVRSRDDTVRGSGHGALCHPCGTRSTKLIRPGTAVPGYRLLRPSDLG